MRFSYKKRFYIFGSVVTFFTLLGLEKTCRMYFPKSFVRPSILLMVVSANLQRVFYKVGRLIVRILYFVGHFIPEFRDVWNIVLGFIQIGLSFFHIYYGFMEFTDKVDDPGLAYYGLFGSMILSSLIGYGLYIVRAPYFKDIRLFSKITPVLQVRIDCPEDFVKFWEWAEVKGDQETAMQTFMERHNRGDPTTP